MITEIIFGAILALGVACWWLLQREHAVADQAPRRSVLSNRDALRHWIRLHMPELDEELGPLGMNQVRERLNAITGCDVQPGDSIEGGSGVFLAALQAQHAGRTEP